MTAPEVGDWADHKSRTLDPRRVARVRARGRGWQVWLNYYSSEPDRMFGPLPASNYTYTKPPA